MLRYLHFSQRFRKQLRALAKSDKKGSLAAGQTELIIENFRDCGAETEEVRAKRTRHGESRLKNCLKYDLGGGYRLITIREGVHLFFVSVGSHDDTDLWLEKNRGYSISLAFQEEIFETCHVEDRQKEDGRATEVWQVPAPEDAYEEDLRTRIDEKTLRQLFGSFYNL